ENRSTGVRRPPRMKMPNGVQGSLTTAAMPHREPWHELRNPTTQLRRDQPQRLLPEAHQQPSREQLRWRCSPVERHSRGTRQCRLAVRPRLSHQRLETRRTDCRELRVSARTVFSEPRPVYRSEAWRIERGL